MIPPRRVEPAELLRTVLAELLLARGMTRDVEDTLLRSSGTEVVHDPAPSAATIVGLQTVDVLSQQLDALSAFLAALIPAVPPGPPVDIGPALDRIVLGAMQARLANGEPFGPTDTAELF
ncbi:MAG: hypothetical protein INR65_03635 [Gluconacetobacter diazotrophicus]|nr:hypothetical protein [Gluconacetobacter diazotrophicus]